MSGFFGDTVGIQFEAWGIYHLIPMAIVIIGVLLIYLFKDKIRESGHDKAIRYTLGTLGIIAEVSLQLWLILNGNWTAKANLPVGLCAFSLYLGVFVMFTKNYKVFEIAYFWSIGGVISVLFPDILYGPDNFRYYNFLFLHMVFFFMYMYMLFVEEYIPTFSSFKKSFFLLLAIVLFVIVPVNLIFGTNFMYLLQPGDTPFGIFWGHGYAVYLIGCILLAMAVMTLWYAPLAIYHKYKAK